MNPLLTAEESGRYQRLRERAERGERLNEVEATDLTDLEKRWEAADADRLNVATAHIEANTILFRSKNQSLKELLQRKRELAIRLESMLEELRVEQEVINAEITRLLSSTEVTELARVHVR